MMMNLLDTLFVKIIWRMTKKIVIIITVIFSEQFRLSSRLLASFGFIPLRNYLLHSSLNLPLLQLMFITRMDRSKESEPREEGNRAVLIGTKHN